MSKEKQINRRSFMQKTAKAAVLFGGLAVDGPKALGSPPGSRNAAAAPHQQALAADSPNIASTATEQGDAFPWQAHYIFTHQWGREQPIYDPTNLFLIFRKTINLPSQVKAGQARLFVDTRYQLFVNGHRVGRGPVHSAAFYFLYDFHELGPFLRVGKNQIAILVNTLGNDGTGWYVPPPWSPVRGALIFEADLKLANGQSTRVISDSSWKFARHTGWLQGTPRVNPENPPMEVYDARLEPVDWKSVDFDDSSWRNAVVLSNSHGLSKPPMEPYFHLLRRPIPYPTEEDVWPEKILAVGETESVMKPMARLAETITSEQHYSLENFRISEPGPVRPWRTWVTIEPSSPESRNPRDPYIIVDFGRQVVGYLRLEVDSEADSIIDIAFAEEMKDGHVNATSPEGNYVARYTTTQGLQGWERFNWYGFRFVQFTFRNINKPIRFRTNLNFSTFPRGNGSFTSSDHRINQIRDTAQYTLELCTWDHFLDVTQREQRQYLGDGQLEVLAHYACNGNISIVKKFLMDGARTQRPDGLLRMATGAGWPPTDIIPDYNFSWIDSLSYYYLYTGDFVLIQEVYPSLVKCLSWFHANTQRDGFLGQLPYWVFLDFSGPDKRGTSSILNARYFLTLKEGVSFARLVGDQHHVDMWGQAAARLKESFDEHFWDESRGVYVDAWIDGQKSPYIGQLANGMAILSGLASEKKIQRVLKVIFDPKRSKLSTPLGYRVNRYLSAVDPPPRPKDFDVTSDVAIAQPFGFHFVMMALAKIGRYDLQISQVKDRWGKELDQGATAFWGDWDRENTLAAGWSSTPAYYFATTILGIRPLKSGFSVFAVEPHTVGLDWAKGSFPSVRGAIPVSWTASSGNFHLEGEVPEGTSAEILLPRTQRGQPREVRFDGRIVWQQGQAKNLARLKGVREEDNGVRVALAQPGKYELIALY